jgi:hypothetical protein
MTKCRRSTKKTTVTAAEYCQAAIEVYDTATLLELSRIAQEILADPKSSELMKNRAQESLDYFIPDLIQRGAWKE